MEAERIDYATLCTGMGGFDLAFDRSGMNCVFQCEQEKSCLSVLERHWPGIARTEDVNDRRTTEELVRRKPRVVGFGSPCQDLSVAGPRGGLSGQRSGLFYRCVELCFECEAPWVVWENVPGVFSSNGGADFAAVIEAFTGFAPTVTKEGWRDSGVCIGPLYSIAWAVLDSQWFGVPQRRRRVFIVGSLGDRSGPYQILFEPDSVPWNTPPSRKAGARVAGTIAGGAGTARTGNGNECDMMIAGTLNSGGNSGGSRTEPGEHLVPTWWDGSDTAPCLDSSTLAKRQTMPDKNRFAGVVTHSLRGEGFDASEDGTGRGTPIVPVAFGWNKSPSQTMRVSETSPAVQASPTSNPAVCAGFKRGQGAKARSDGYQLEQSPTLTSSDSGAQQSPGVQIGSMVRRLTPRECERLQAFPDDWSKYGHDGKEISDSARYKMAGNAVTTFTVEWLAMRLADRIKRKPKSQDQ